MTIEASQQERPGSLKSPFVQKSLLSSTQEQAPPSPPQDNNVVMALPHPPPSRQENSAHEKLESLSVLAGRYSRKRRMAESSLPETPSALFSQRMEAAVTLAAAAVGSSPPSLSSSSLPPSRGTATNMTGSNDDDDEGESSSFSSFPLLQSLSFSSWLYLLGGTTVGLYILNQKKCLPRSLSRWVSWALLWPTLPLTFLKRQTLPDPSWITPMDETVIMGGLPLGNLPRRLYHEHQVRGVINLCDEYRGPVRVYRQLGSGEDGTSTTSGGSTTMQQLYLPTPDHFEPDVRDLETAVEFIRQHQERHQRVYVHCKAGHGRSAAVVLCWLLDQELWRQSSSPKLPSPPRYRDQNPLRRLNEHMLSLRKVRKSLWQQPNIRTVYQNQLLKYQQQQPAGEEEEEKDEAWRSPLSNNENDEYDIATEELSAGDVELTPFLPRGDDSTE